MEYNLLKLGFGFMTAFIIVMGTFINFAERHLPTYFVRTFRFGKHAYKGASTSSIIKSIELPKSWFRHFYLFAAGYTGFVMVVATNIYFYEGTLRPWMVTVLDLLASSSRKANVSAVSTYVALSLMTLQAWHRFYETWFVSVFSNARMNLTHYIVGYVHYFGSVTVILAEAPGFFSNTDKEVIFSLGDLRALDVIGTTLFVAACYLQYKSAVLLANLRKNSKGHVVTHKHMIPKGSWFDLISSPHLFAETIMYFAVTLVLWGSHTWPYVFLWVLSNQVENALLAHWWYKDTFKHYPKARKAIFPYIL